MSVPVLVACAHGTRDPQGAAQVAALVEQVAHRHPELTVLPAYVDLQQPDLPTVLSSLVGRDAVVVPLLLSAGFHVHVDIRRAVEAAALEQPAAGRVRVAGALGPDQRLVGVLAERLAAAGGDRADHVVLAAAGSSDPRAAADVDRMATALAVALSLPVSTGYLSAARPSVVDAVRRARADGAVRVAVATYLLAPGVFTDRLAEVGADLVTAPLLPHPMLADLVLHRYRQVTAG